MDKTQRLLRQLMGSGARYAACAAVFAIAACGDPTLERKRALDEEAAAAGKADGPSICDVYGQCSPCANDNGCKWCDGQCVALGTHGSVCAMVASQCSASTPADAAPQPTTPLYGFTPGVQLAAESTGTTTENVSGDWTCKRRTLTGLPCGGWVALSSLNGVPQVALGVMGHYDFYTNVTGHASYEPDRPFPPAANNRFWRQSATIALDASGHGSFDDIRKDWQGYESAEYHYVVDAVEGAVTVRYSGSLDPLSCSYDETCTFVAGPATPSATPGCTPSSCATNECGTFSNGCGGVHDCGSCPYPQQCSADHRCQ
jgi:hypothetical protein